MTQHVATHARSINGLWLLRLLMPLGGHKTFVSKSGFSDDALVTALGLEAWQESENRAFDEKGVRLRLRQLHQEAEAAAHDLATPGCLATNVARLQKLVDLSDMDCRILEFAVAVHNDRLLDEAADGLGDLSNVKLFHILAVVLGVPERDVRSALNAQGALARIGLLSVDRDFARLRTKLRLLSRKFAETISSSEADPVSFLRGTVSLAAPPVLAMHDYEHVKSSLEVLHLYLKRSMESRRHAL